MQVRSLSVLEGIALASDPNYKVLGATYPWIARRLLTDRSPELRVRRAQDGGWKLPAAMTRPADQTPVHSLSAFRPRGAAHCSH